MDVLEVQDDLYDKKLYAYCDNNPINRVDEEGDVWELAAVGSIGKMLGTAALTISNVALPIAVGIGIGIVVGVVIHKGIELHQSKAKVENKIKKKSLYRMSKGGKQRIKDSGLEGIKPEDIREMLRNKNLSGVEKRRLQKQQKALDTRNIQKRSNKKKNSGKKKR